ncbi:MAG: hypothetical protein ThorAB25_05480 [Candidatus Thorarchaeota archaeon AB_25]|nr:MAG: hypothetical protein ThorAB25_05480 [Candidatus Thorarchaeota archaeon AB_25]
MLFVVEGFGDLYSLMRSMTEYPTRAPLPPKKPPINIENDTINRPKPAAPISVAKNSAITYA